MNHLSLPRTAARIALLCTVLMPGPLLAQTSDRADGMRFIPDVEGQFASLARMPEPLGLHISTTPDPSACRHYQGIQRIDGPDGTPFFWVTRSGNSPDIYGFEGIVCDDSENERYNGNLMVFRMGSRDKSGERLRSNRLRKGTHVDETAPSPEDIATIYYTVVGGTPNHEDPCQRPGLIFREGYIDEDGDGQNDCSLPAQRAYQHPGGMQRLGTIMALATDTPRNLLAECYADCTRGEPENLATCVIACNSTVHYEMAATSSLILFFDAVEPENPVFLSQFVPRHSNGTPLGSADGLAITPLPNGRYLMAVSEGFFGDEPIFFYRSSSSDLKDPNLTWVLVGSPHDVNDRDEDAHQSLHFLRQGSIDGPLYLAGSRGNPALGPDHDKLDLFQVTCDFDSCPDVGEIHLDIRNRGQAMSTFPNTGGERLANLTAATGFYESPSGELIFYATEHDNDGPGSTVKMGEWRHQDIVREGSPTLLPTIEVGGPYDVDEGSAVVLGGSAAPPTTRAFIQAFVGPDFLSYHPVVDFDDYGKDDFDDFSELEPFSGLVDFTYDNLVRSWKWYAPKGCSIQAIDRLTDGTEETCTLAGTGEMVAAADLTQVFNDAGTGHMNLKVDAVRFLDCDTYYATPVALRWDLDVDGTYETAGTTPTFDAGALDGPATLQIAAKAQPPSDGAPAFASAAVNVHNVPPTVTQVGLVDSGGNQVGTEIPFALVGAPITVHASFGDPGRPDHQTATVDWGDGQVDPQSAFALFDEAFGDGTGALSQAHRYALPGTFAIGVAVTDDDGGAGSGAASVRVLTPEQAVGEILAALDALIAQTTDPDLRALLLKARKALAGSPPFPSRNGALARIQAGNNYAAIAFLRDAIFWLQSASTTGGESDAIITQIQQVIAALSTRVGRPSGADRLGSPIGRIAIPVR